MGRFDKIKKIVCRLSGKCYNCGQDLSMSNRNKTQCISCEWTQSHISNNKEIFKMQTKEGKLFDLTYTGYTCYSPNRSSTCGYGSDDWLYLCHENNTYYLLMFSDSASYGTAWMCTELLEGDYEKLTKKDVVFWTDIAYSKDRSKIYTMHLTNVDNVRHLLPTRSRCCDNLTDEHF